MQIFQSHVNYVRLQIVKAKIDKINEMNETYKRSNKLKQAEKAQLVSDEETAS